MYRGRFAPSPTGPLHHGSLIAALASYLDAKANQGHWILRIEDIDELRTVDSAESSILYALEAHGLQWDERAPNQSDRKDRYLAALDQLAQNNWLFACDCPRKLLRQIGGVYPGHCRRKTLNSAADSKKLVNCASVRFNSSLATPSIDFEDLIQGRMNYALDELGDFIVKRRDGLFAYQLAVVVDDQDQNITDIVRGTDLLDSTPWQIVLQKALGFRPSRYLHFPVLVRNGSKLSKQTGANGVLTDNSACRRNLLWAMQQLGQTLPTDANANTTPDVDSLLSYAIENWDRSKIPRSTTLPDTRLLP